MIRFGYYLYNHVKLIYELYNYSQNKDAININDKTNQVNIKRKQSCNDKAVIIPR